MAAIDMTGRTCGELTVLYRDDRPGTKVKWICVCACGNTTSVDGTKLRNGRTKTCGHTQGLGSKRRADIDRFLEKIQPAESGCIEWTGGLNGAGYGQFYVGRTSLDETGKSYAHRWSYQHYVGPIPEGMHLDHLCRNRKCVNPEHLEPVTLRENVLRGEGPSANHAKKTHCPQGHSYSGGNLYVHPVNGQRYCRECGRLRALAKRKRERERRNGKAA
uniref:HNH endonuclease signature motif containing protein n=1 Tax=Mycolicibacterium fortuitum TaxID=1766 RepID=UPI00351F6BF2